MEIYCIVNTDTGEVRDMFEDYDDAEAYLQNELDPYDQCLYEIETRIVS